MQAESVVGMGDDCFWSWRDYRNMAEQQYFLLFIGDDPHFLWVWDMPKKISVINLSCGEYDLVSDAIRSDLRGYAI